MNRCIAAVAMLLIVPPVLAVDGEPGMHDPSTVIQADGKFYVYGTGTGLPAYVSDDGWTWRRAGQRPPKRRFRFARPTRQDARSGPG